jgi:hypothetical protein
MTEAEWLAATDPESMLEFLRGKISDRKLRLLVAAACHRIWWLLPQASRTFVETLVAYADGLVTNAEYHAASDAAFAEADAADRDPPNTLTYATVSVGISDSPTVASVMSCLDTATSAVGCATAEDAPEGEYDFQYDCARMRERAEQSRLVLDIFGPLPFRPVTVDPSWLTSTVAALVRGVYTERAFDRLPILADALQDAGCDNDDLLTHCRSDGPHVRGCWVVDLLLGKQ